MKKLDRRDFIKKSTLTAAAISSTPLLSSCVNNPSKKNNGIYMGAFAASKLSTVRAAFIGVGNRGRGHLKFFYSNQQTSLISTKSFTNINTLPIFADVNNQQYGIGFKYLHYINEFYPKKGYHITASIAFGNRTIIRNSQVQQNLYDSINLQSIQFNANLTTALYLPLAKRSVLYLGTQLQHIAATNLFQNEFPDINQLYSILINSSPVVSSFLIATIS